MEDKEFQEALESIRRKKKEEEQALAGCLKACFDMFFLMLLGGILTYILMRLGWIS